MFVYRHLKPYRKWSTPPVDIAVAEMEVWSDLKIDLVDVNTAVQRLAAARDGGVKLSSRSMDLLALEGDECADERLDYVTSTKNLAFVQQTLITCMDVLNKDNEDHDAISLLIVGTESGHVYILPQDPSNSNFLCKIALPGGAIPTMFCTSGLFDVDWRLVVATSDEQRRLLGCRRRIVCRYEVAATAAATTTRGAGFSSLVRKEYCVPCPLF